MNPDLKAALDTLHDMLRKKDPDAVAMLADLLHLAKEGDAQADMMCQYLDKRSAVAQA